MSAKPWRDVHHWCEVGAEDIEIFDRCVCGHRTADHDWAGCGGCDGCTIDVYSLRRRVVQKAKWKTTGECDCNRREPPPVETGRWRRVPSGLEPRVWTPPPDC